MKFDWIIAGALLLGCALMLHKLRDKGAFQVLVLLFVVCWGGLAAVHCWSAALAIARGFAPAPLAEGQIVLLAFWLGFAVLAVPSALLVRFWLRDYATTFPVFIDTCILWIGSGLLLLVFSLLMLMSVALYVPRDPSGGGWALRVYETCRRLPVDAYLAVAGGTAGSSAPGARQRQLPDLVRARLLGETARPASGVRRR